MKKKTRKLMLSGGAEAIVDADFVVPLNARGKPCKYHLRPDGYARIKNSRRDSRLHNDAWIQKHGPIPKGMTVDHADRNKLNCATSNLRLADAFGQRRNRGSHAGSTSVFKGVSAETASGKKRWCALIRAGSEQRRKAFPGTRAGEIEAARQYDAWARKLHGKYAVLNFPIKKKAARRRAT